MPLITLLLGLSAPYVAHGQGDYTLSASEVTAPPYGRQVTPDLERDAVALMTLCA